MEIKDIQDTIECRNRMIDYINYLEKCDERIPDKFMMHVLENITSKAGLVAMLNSMKKITKKIDAGIKAKDFTMEEADIKYNLAKEKVFKHCLILEVKHNQTRKESLLKHNQRL